MSKTGLGTLLLLAGIIALVMVHSMRPPSGIMDAFAMMAQGRQTFIKEPFYQILLALAGIVTFFGALLVYLGLSQRRGRAS